PVLLECGGYFFPLLVVFADRGLAAQLLDVDARHGRGLAVTLEAILLEGGGAARCRFVCAPNIFRHARRDDHARAERSGNLPPATVFPKVAFPTHFHIVIAS